MEKIIKYFGQNAKIVCDEKCNKAWGLNGRPSVQLSDDPDDYYFLSDNELGEAPIATGNTEGGQDKPRPNEKIPNNWCVRECERCSMSMPGESHLPLEPKDFSKRFYNIPQN